METETLNEPLKPEQFEFSQAETVAEAKKIKSIIEAVLFASHAPVTLGQIFYFLKESFLITKKDVEKFIEELKLEYDESKRSFELTELHDGFQLLTRKEFSPHIKKFLKISTTEKLSKSALETLAIIAYKQPITRAEIEQVRGVNIDGVMKVLIEKGLIQSAGQKDVPGKPQLYVTTKLFLTIFGLKSIGELPPIGEQNLN